VRRGAVSGGRAEQSTMAGFRTTSLELALASTSARLQRRALRRVHGVKHDTR